MASPGEDFSSPDAWACPICQDLIYKPVANHCGHFFCFWCLHKSMSPWTASKCPICRAKFGHFPAVVIKLHTFLKASFPEEYAQRAAETQEQEKADDVASPEFPEEEAAAASCPGNAAMIDFLCDVCGELLCHPLALNCGHLVCGGSSSCLGPSPGAGLAASCRTCGQPAAHRPSVCKQLQYLLVSSFPQEYARRAASLPAEQPQPLQQVEAAGESPREGLAVASSSPPASGGGGGDGGGGSGGGGAVSNPRALLLQRLHSEEYVHFGIGCDFCGLYPIVGRRFRCLDCPEAIGFDLCGACYDRGQGAITGRFAQHHTAAHCMEESRKPLTGLHMLQAANPELTFEQLMAMLEMSWDPNGAAVEEQENEGDGVEEGEETGDIDSDNGGAQWRQHLEERHAEEEGRAEGEAEAPMLRPRGPRPAPDPSAEWPSPSAPE